MKRPSSKAPTLARARRRLTSWSATARALPRWKILRSPTKEKVDMLELVSSDDVHPVRVVPTVPAEFISRIVEELHPLQIWLYGSRVKGSARPDSDWDFLAVVNDSAPEDDLDLVTLWRRLQDIHRKRVEVIPITRADFERFKLSLGSLAQIVNDEGVVVYGE